MSRQFNLEKYLKENRILGQSGTSLLREQQEKGDVAVERPNGSVVKYFNSYEEAKEWVDMNDPDGMVDYNIRNMNEEVVYEQEEEGDEEVEDVEDIEGGEEEIEEPLDTEEPISDDEEELQDTLTKAYNQAEKIGDTKLTQQISNTITYYVKTLLRNQ